MGDKCSVKRSVIGRHCRIGSNVKVPIDIFSYLSCPYPLNYFFCVKKKKTVLQIVNSIVMNHVTIEDSCTIQGSVISSNVQIQERASLKDCQVNSLFIQLIVQLMFFYFTRVQLPAYMVAD